jgi:ribosomal protein S18 acetylase RimI-like enzyme
VGVGDLAHDPRRRTVHLGCEMLGAVIGLADRVRVEGVGREHVGTRFGEALANAADHLRLGEVEQVVVAALVALERELFGVDAWSETAVREELEGPGRRFVVSTSELGIDGYAVTMTAGDIVDLLRIAVRPSARRRGLASALLDAVLVDTDDASRMLLEVSVANREALDFYVARQFNVIDVRPHYYRDGSEALVMCRWLPGASRTMEKGRHD